MADANRSDDCGGHGLSQEAASVGLPASPNHDPCGVLLHSGGHTFSYRVDDASQLFLSMSAVNPSLVVRGDDGIFKYAPTGVAPCVLHFVRRRNSNPHQAPPSALACPTGALFPAATQNGYSKGLLQNFTHLANSRPSSYDAWAVPAGEKYGAPCQADRRCPSQ